MPTVEIGVKLGEFHEVFLSCEVEVQDLNNSSERVKIREIIQNLLKTMPSEEIKSLDDSFCDEEKEIVSDSEGNFMTVSKNTFNKLRKLKARKQEKNIWNLLVWILYTSTH